MYKLLILLMLFTTQIKAEESFKLLIGFPPGGGQHIVGQILEEGLNEMGYKALLINKPGAGGVIAMNECATKSDPRLLCLVSQSQLVHSGILSPDAVKYDPANLTYVKLLGESPMVLLSNINNTKTLPEILMDIKNNKVTFGSGALGNTQAAQSLMKHVNSKEGIDVTYKGVGPAIIDLMGGHVTYVIAPYTAAKNQIDNNLVRLVAGLDDTSYIPNLPKIANFSVTATRFGFVTGTHLDPISIKTQHQLLVSLMENKIVQSKLKDQGIFIANKNLTGNDYKRFTIQEIQSLSK